MFMSPPRTRLALLCAGLLSACAVGPDFDSPAPPQVTHYDFHSDPVKTVDAEGSAQTISAAAALSPDWWKLFDCPKLDAIVAEAIAGNQTLDAAKASLREAEDNLRAGYGVFFPQVTAGTSAAREVARLGEVETPILGLYTLTGSVGYVLDIFGGERRQVEGLGAQRDYQRDALRAAYLSLAANIVNTVVADAAYEAEIEATQEIVGFQSEQVRLAKVQAQAGTMDYAAVLSLIAAEETTEATLPQLRQKQAQARHLLAILTGHFPADWTPPEIAFGEIVLPTNLPLSLPSSLVRQRPDIRQAEATLHTASAAIGVATAAMLPSFTLDATAGWSGLSHGNLLSNANKIWSFDAAATTPLFEGGSLWYKRKAAIADFEAARANYRQTVLTAFGQVADTLRALEHDAEALSAEERAVETARRALSLVQANYATGLADYTALLIADAQFQQAQIALLQIRAVRYQDTVTLFVALGGGWWNASAEE